MRFRWLVVLLLPLLAGCGSSEAADAGELADRAASIGVDPDVVYAVSLDGFAPASQSTGVVGDAGFGVAYTSPSGGLVMLSTDPHGGADAGCVAAGGQQECVAVHDGVAVRLTAAADVLDEETLRAAVEDAHPPTSDELAALFADAPSGGAPVERDDLPPSGDGAPIDPEGAAG
ncbi:hypothetical protein [Jiangella anatolica]|uniref:Membrane lipoprotein n=1 Tax=Jiangella anatolica TaxID=2670374 RepID=A0A2W2BBF9_9ACTN|nr:hypothetical protein [Jiangella anatolica]PZF83442.1 hypothetical protein C1I92_12640 [Jiangella anatolica]